MLRYVGGLDKKFNLDSNECRGSIIYTVSNHTVCIEGFTGDLLSLNIEPCRYSCWRPLKHSFNTKKPCGEHKLYSEIPWTHHILFNEQLILLEGCGVNDRVLKPKVARADLASASESWCLKKIINVLKDALTFKGVSKAVFRDGTIYYMIESIESETNILASTNEGFIEFKSPGKLELKIKTAVVNPKVYWIQPFYIACSKLDVGDEVSSNLVAVSDPLETIHVASRNPIRVFNEGNCIKLVVNGLTKMFYSRRFSFNVLRRFYECYSSIYDVGFETPLIKLYDPRIIPFRLEWSASNEFIEARITLSNPTWSRASSRIYVKPPYYIYRVECFMDGVILNWNSNSIEVLINEYSCMDVKVVFKKTFLRRTAS